MKIRTGFVSNSSSSSFMVLGYEIPYSRANIMELGKRFGFEGDEDDIYDEVYDSDELLVDSEGGIIYIGCCERIDEYEASSMEVDLKKVEELGKKCKDLIRDDKIKMYGGTMAN